MAALRSVFYLFGAAGVSFMLFSLVTSGEDSIKSELKTKGYIDAYDESSKKQKQFLDVIKKAAISKEPLYKHSKKEIENELKK